MTEVACNHRALWDAPTMLGGDYCTWLIDHRSQPLDLWAMMEVFVSSQATRHCRQFMGLF